MQKLTFCLALLLLCLSSNVSAQIYSKAELSGADRLPGTERCGTNQYMLQRFAENPELYARYLEVQEQLYPSDENLKSQITCTAANTVRVPLAFHFDNSFDCSDQTCILTKIEDAITTLNVDFGSNVGSPNAANCPGAYPDISTGTCIEFYLAAPPACSGLDVNCDGAITVGQFAGGYSGGGNGAGACWDDYLNVFVQSPQSGNLGVADQIPDALPADGPGEGVTLGSPYFGGTGGPCGTIDTDGTYNLGKTLAHEIGHYLGLFHSFQGGCNDEPNNTFNGTNITVNDTPAQQQQYFGCPTGCVASGCGGNQQTANIMNYTDDACMDMFSEDQAAAMNVVANGLFGNLNIPEADPAELYGACTGNACTVVCPTVVQTAYAGSEDVCAGVGTYTLPSTYTGLVLDDASSATYTWSTGTYISAGGTALANTTLTLANPAGCNPASQIIYLNVACTDGSIADINAGTFTLNVYPDPTQFTEADLVTITGENACGEPILTPNCAGVTITPDAANPTFPVAAGQSGTANYTVTYNAPAGAPNCCVSGGTGGELITNGDFEAGTSNWTETEEVPTGTPNPNPFGVIGVSTNLLNGTSDAWFGGWGGTGGSTITITQNIDIPANCSEALLTFDFYHSCTGNASITLEILVGGVSLGFIDCTTGNTATTYSITPFDIIAAGAPTGITTISFVGVETDPAGGGGGDNGNMYIDNVSLISGNCSTPAACDLPVTANYNCAGCTDCNDTTCTTTQACNDNDPCTENDEVTVITSNGTVCVPCAGTAIASCTGTTSVVACNDGDPCTENDVQTVDDCNGSICVPCAGTAIASCTGTTSVVACNDGDPCTTNDVQTVDDCNGSICVPCAGTAIPSCSGTTSVVACNDGDPCTTNDVQTVDDCNGAICVPCAGTAIASCTSTSIVTCNDGDPCTTNDVQTIDDCNGAICVPCAGTAIASCSGTTSVVACNDGDPCTENDVQTVDDCNGAICVPCAGTAIASCTGSTSVVACNDGDPCTEDDVQTVDDCNGSVCVPCAGTAIASCTGTTSVVACNDGDPCTEDDVQTVDDCNGSVCVPCAGTAIASCTGTTSVVACNDGDPCTENDVQTVDDCNGSICVPCAGTAIASCSGTTSVVACNDGDPCTENDVQTVDDCNGSVCVPCAGTAIASCSGTTSVVACNDGDPCTEDDVQTVDDCNGSVCVPCAGTAIASCTGTTSVVACNDGDPCTEDDVQTVDDCNGSVCVPCAGTAIASCTGTTSVVACNDGDPCTEDDVQTIDDCDGSICVPCAGTAIASCTGTTSIVACNDGDPCTEDDVQTVDDCNGSICVPCAGTAVAACSQMLTQACNDNDNCTISDVEIIDACTGAVCVPCAGTAIADCSGTTSVVTCDDNDPCTINDVQTIDDCNGSVCVPCAGVFTPSACCSDVNLNINFDGFPAQTSWEITEVSTGDVVTSGGGYGSLAANSNLNLPGVACLLDGCYELTFNDALNNGMCPFRSTASSLGTFITPGTLISPGSIVATLGTVVTPGLCGNYSLTDINGTTLVSGGGAFGAQQTKTFCLSGGIATLWQPDNGNTHAKQQQSFTGLRIYPTLTKDDLFVEIPEVSQGQMNIVDMNGQIIQRYEQIQPQMRLDVSELSAGIYFVQMVANDTVFVEKFIKK